MAGVVSYKKQAEYFNRPNANVGSILSVWNKRFGFKSVNINGMSHRLARHIVKSSCPIVSTETMKVYFEKRKKIQLRRTCLWVDMIDHLKSDAPEFIVEAIDGLADFQRWLHGNDARASLIDLVKSRGGVAILDDHGYDRREV